MKGLGSDIIEIKRIKKATERLGDRFLNKIFTEEEKKYAFSHKDPYPHLAARFAAKEAVAKALGVGLRAGLTFLDIEIIKDDLGKPLVKLHHPSFAQKGQLHLSISHCKEMAMAVVILEE